VAQTAYGLSATEILLADDKDLNEYVGLKKLAPYRKLRETWDAKRPERLHEFKKKVSTRLGGVGADIVATEHLVDGDRRAKKRKGKKERTREKAARAPEEVEVAGEVEKKVTDSPMQSNKHTKWQRDDDDEHLAEMTASEPSKKKRRRQKKAEKSKEQAVV
jgi:protein KRI1